MTDVVIGLDVGTSSIKAIAYDRSGLAVGIGRASTPSLAGPSGPDFPIPQVLATARAVTRAAAAGSKVAGIGLASMGEVGAVVGVAGALLGQNFPAWHDDRGAEVAARLRTSFPHAYAQSGGHLRAMSSLAKLAWLAGRGHDLKGCFLGIGGLLAYGWTGDLWQEASLAATSGAFDPVAGGWMAELWSAAGLDEVRLPVVFRPGVGVRARGGWANEDGLSDALVVIAGHDHPVAAVGTGSAAGSVVDSLGTGEPVIAAWTTARPTPAQISDLVEGGLTVETWPATGDPMLVWEGLCPGQAMAALLTASGLDREVLEAVPPLDMIVGSFTRKATIALERGDPGPLDQRDLTRSSPVSAWQAAWLDLLAAYARDAARGERIVRSATGAAGPVVVTGGGTRSKAWREAKRKATTSEIHFTTLTDTGSRGAAAIVGASLQWWDSASMMPVQDVPPARSPVYR